MATNIVETIRQNLGYAPLHKIDPNIQESKEKWHQDVAENMSQAALPAVLTALFKFSRAHDNNEQIINSAGSEDWLHILYGGKEQVAIDKVATYAGAPADEVELNMENIADEAIRVVKSAIGADPKPEAIKNYMNGQRHEILVHLPAALQLGDLLKDETLDDRTNKMEGPVSNFMHKIGNTMSGSDE